MYLNSYMQIEKWEWPAWGQGLYSCLVKCIGMVRYIHLTSDQDYSGETKIPCWILHCIFHAIYEA